MRGFRIFAMSGLGAFALAFLAYGVAMAVRGEWLTAAVAVAAAVPWGAAAMTWSIMPTATPLAVADDLGTTIRPDRRVDRYMLVCLVGGIVGFGGIGVFGTLGRLKLPLPHEADLVWMMCLPWAAPALVFAAALLITVRRGSMTRVRLTPGGFEFAERFSTRGGEWADVVDVSNEAPDKPQANSPVVVSMADGSTVILMESALLGPRDGLYHLMDYLWRHPDSRSELTDGRAVARLLAV